MDPRTEQKLLDYLARQDTERKREGMRAMLDDLTRQHEQYDHRLTLDGRAMAEALAKQDPGPQPDRTALDIALAQAGRPPQK